MEKQYTLTIYCENRIGLIGRVAVIFTRRHINIESFIASETEVKDVYKLTVVATSTREQLDKIVTQIEKLIEVHKAFVHEEDEVVYQEMALYKISMENLESQDIERLIRKNHVHVLSITSRYVIVEKTGHQEDLLELLRELEPYGLIEYATSGRVAILKWSKHFHEHLKDLSLVEEDNLSIGR